MLPKPLARRVVTAARRFQDREPWLDFHDEHLFAFEIPGEPLPIYAIVLGAGGKEFGLSMYFGERALEQVHHVTRGPQPPFLAPILLLSFDPIGAVPPELRELTRLAGCDERVIPTVFSIAIGGRRRTSTANELRFTAQVVEAMLLADQLELLRPRAIDLRCGGKVLTITVAGTASKVDGVTARYVRIAPPANLAPAPANLPSQLAELPLVDTHLVVGFAQSPVGAAGQASRPWLLMLIDPATDRIVGMRMVPLDEPGDLDQAVLALARFFAAPMQGEPGLPRRLTVAHDRLASALIGLAERGVTIDSVDQHPSTNKVLQGLREQLAQEAAEDSTVPAAADRQRWLVHHRRLLERIAAEFDSVDHVSHTALATFFGDEAVYAEVDEMGGRLHRSAFRDWYLTCFRGKTGRRTIAERLLTGYLPPAERSLLEARVAARTGLWVVASQQPAVVVLRDVFTNEEVEIHDGSLAMSTSGGSALPARLADANGHRFVIPLGPQVPAAQLDAALARLHENFGAFTSADLQRRPEMLGSLWRWALDEEAAEQDAGFTDTVGTPREHSGQEPGHPERQTRDGTME